MFNFKGPQSAKRVVEPRELREKVNEQVLIVADMRRSVGRPRHSVLGDERMQVDVEVVTHIVGLVVDAYGASGAVLHESLDKLYTIGGRRDYARDVLNRLSRGRSGVVSDIPAEALYQSLGPLVKVGKGKSSAPGRRGLSKYILRDSAGPLELTAAWNARRKSAAEAEARFSEVSDLFAAVVPSMPPNMTLGEYRTQQTEAYHREQVRRAQAQERS